MGIAITGSTSSINLDYSEHLFNYIFNYLKKGDIDQVLDVLQSYNLTLD